MKSTGVVRKIDELGRVVIPKELRRKLGIKEKDPIEIHIDNHSIILKKIESHCIFCGKEKDLIPYKDKLICPKCLDELKNK